MTAAGVRRWRTGDPIPPLKALIARGGVLAVPTESSYGLAVDPANQEAVERVFNIKRRSPDQPLPIVVADLKQIRDLGVEVPDRLASLLESLWPAPLTVLLPAGRDLPAAAGSDRLGFRVPDHPALRGLLEELGLGLTATSANLSGAPPVLAAADLEPLLHDEDAVIVDGGELPGGRPSTIVGWRDGRLEVVREGGFPVDKLISFSASSVEISVDDAR